MLKVHPSIINVTLNQESVQHIRAMMYVSTMVDGVDERSRVIRRTLMRYLTLSSLIVFQATSVVVKKRFPTMEHLLEAG